MKAGTEAKAAATSDRPAGVIGVEANTKRPRRGEAGHETGGMG